MLRLLRENKEAVLIFLVALGARLFLSAWHVEFGLSSFPALFSPNAWDDFNGVYVPWLHFVSKGMVPYWDFTSYIYTPLFLYMLYPFYYLGGSYAASIPIMLSDAATAPVVYLIAKRLASARISLAAGLMYALCPFALFYEGFLWFSSQPMTFFMLLTMYLLRCGRPTYSAVSMALAIMIKQEALFLLPVYLVWLATRFRGSAPRGILVISIIAVIVSLPFLIIDPVRYIISLDYLNPSTSPSVACVNEIINKTTVAVCGGVTSAVSGLTFTTTAGSTVAQAGGFPVAYVLDKIGLFLSPIIFVVALPAVIASRNAPNALELFSAYTLAGFLILFMLVTNIFFSYHYIPVYALLFAAAGGRRTLAVIVAAPAVALFLLPEGPMGPLVTVVAILIVLAAQEGPKRGFSS